MPNIRLPDMDPTSTRQRADECPEAPARARVSRADERRSAWRAASPLLFDVALPVAGYYLLSGAGVADTSALIVSGLVPFARSGDSLARARRGGRADYLAVMVAGVF